MKSAVGVVCYRDEAGEMTGRVKPIYREIPERGSADESGLSPSEKSFADGAADFFGRLFFESNLAEYFDTMKEEFDE